MKNIKFNKLNKKGVAILIVWLISMTFGILSDYGIQEEWFNRLSGNFLGVFIGMVIMFFVYENEKNESKKSDPYYKNEKED